METTPFALLAILTFAGGAPAFSAGSGFTATGVIDMLPTSMSDDASIVVGVGTDGTPNLYYTEADGVSIIGDGSPSGAPAILVTERPLSDFITPRGAVAPAGWSLSSASVISADGKTVYGWGINPDNLIEMFKVGLNTPTTGPDR